MRALESSLTDPQLAVCRYVESCDFPPSLAEIGEALGVTKPTAQDRVSALVRKGFLERNPDNSRDLRLTDHWDRYKRRRFNEQTNPVVEAVMASRPELFSDFTSVELDQLYSMRGYGGALTEDGVIRATEMITENREVKVLFERLLLNESVRDELIEFVHQKGDQVKPKRRSRQRTSA